jgi:signal peptidase I
MSFVEQFIGTIIYSCFHLYYNHLALLISFFIMLSLLYLFFKINVSKSGVISCLIGMVIKKSTSYDHKKSIKEQMKHYRELSRAPRILPVFIPLVITGITAYIIIDKLIFFAIITTGSMSPTLEVKDLVLMQNLKIEPLQGDIIMFETKGVNMPVIHRVYSASGNEIRTKGDASEFVDDWSLKKDQIRGEAVLFQGRPVIIKNIGEYLLFDPKEVKITKYGSEFYRISEIIKNIKQLGLTIFIICIVLYIFTAFTSSRSRRLNR